MADSRPPGISPDDDQATILPASLVAGRYRIERVVGTGAFGRVYLAFDTRLRRNVAIKELLASREQTDREMYARYVERFQREARATSTIQDPNVVITYDQHVDEVGDNYLVMEYVDGTNLRDLLAQVGRLPPSRVVAIGSDIAAALEAVHEHEIVHRDVTPANIIITRRGAAKLMDFGVARIAHEAQMTVTSSGHPGTPMYMSPEQSAGYGYIDGRSDLYSLGLVLYEMLVGEPYALRRQSLGVVRPDLSRSLIAVVDKLMATDVNARYETATDVLTDLRDLGTMDAQTIVDTRPISNENRLQPGSSPPVWPPTGSSGGEATIPSGYSAPIYPPPAPPASSGYGPLPAQSSGGGYPPPVYPGTPAYGIAPSPSGPPKKSNRGAVFGIGAGVIAVLAVIGIVVFITRGRGEATATATPARSTPGVTVTALLGSTGGTATGTTTQTAAPTTATATATRATATLTPAPTTPATGTPATASATQAVTTPTVARSVTPGPTGQLTTWTEQNGLIKVQYPSNWAQTRDNANSSNLVQLQGPSNSSFLDINLNDPQQGTIADEMQIIVKNQQTSTKFSYSDQKMTDTQIAGEPAKQLAFTYTDKTDASKSAQGIWWVVNHGGKQFSILASPIGSRKAEIDAIVGSLTFGNGKTMTWTDPDGVIRAQYPSDWQGTKDASDKSNALSLTGSNNEIRIFVEIFTPGTETIDQNFKRIRDTASDDGTTVRVYDPVLDTKVGGKPAKSLAYRYTPKASPNNPAGIATIWIVDYNGKRYQFSCSNMASHRAEIEAFINSVTFLK